MTWPRGLDGRADVLRPIVTADYLRRFATPGNDLRGVLESRAMWAVRKSTSMPSGFAVEVVNHVEQPEASAVFS